MRMGRDDAQQAWIRSGTRMTMQRQLILEYLYERLFHPSAEQLFRSIAKDHPKVVSLTTIYNNLRRLGELGLIREFYLHDSGTARYDANLEPHSHLVCEQCGSIADWDEPAVRPVFPLLSAEGKGGFRASGVVAEVTGVCSSCSEAQEKATAPAGGLRRRGHSQAAG